MKNKVYLLKKLQGIEPVFLIADFKMQVIAGGIARGSHVSDQVSGGNMLSDDRRALRLMRIKCRPAVSMIDFYKVSV